jgi:hypothetical protein
VKPRPGASTVTVTDGLGVGVGVVAQTSPIQLDANAPRYARIHTHRRVPAASPVYVYDVALAATTIDP